MNKEELFSRVSDETWLSKNIVERIFQSCVNQIAIALQNGESIAVKGFGTFSVRKAAPRTGRNPHTGEAVPVPARMVPVFKPSKVLKEKIMEERDV